jgi:hypothetical protein
MKDKEPEKIPEKKMIIVVRFSHWVRSTRVSHPDIPSKKSLPFYNGICIPPTKADLDALVKLGYKAVEVEDGNQYYLEDEVVDGKVVKSIVKPIPTEQEE